MTNIRTLLNATWKVGLGLAGLAALTIGIVAAVSSYRSTHGRASWKDEKLSAGISVHGFNDGRVRVWNERTSRYVTPKLKWVSDKPLRDSLTVYCDLKGNRGYINCNSGVPALPAEKYAYRHAWYFSEGRAVVVLPGEDSLSVIDREGNIVVRNIAPHDPGQEYVFCDGLCEFRREDHYGLLSKDASWAIAPRYDEIENPDAFGYRIARNEEGYWLFNPQMQLTFPEPYEKLEYAAGRGEGEGNIFRSANHKKQLVNYDGSVVEPFVIDGTYSLRYVVKYNEEDYNEYALDPDLVVYRVDGWEGLMNKHTGRLVTPAVYTDFDMISKDLIKAELSNNYNDQSLVMDRNGHIVRQ